MRNIKELNRMNLINFQENELEFVNTTWGKDTEGNKLELYIAKELVDYNSKGYVRRYLREKEVERLIDKQDALKKQVKDKIERAKRERAEQEQAEQEYNDLKGFAKNKSNMQLGRIKKTLNREYFYRKYDRTMTRKDYIITLIKEGYNEIDHNCKHVSEGERTLMKGGGNFYSESDFTKTEFDFAEYLIENDIIH